MQLSETVSEGQVLLLAETAVLPTSSQNVLAAPCQPETLVDVCGLVSCTDAPLLVTEMPATQSPQAAHKFMC